MPPGLTSEQRAAVRLLYSPNPSDRANGVSGIWHLEVPHEVQIPYLVALLADDPKLQDEPPTSPMETWFWKLLGTKLGKEDVQGDCRKLLGCMEPADAPAMLQALKSEADAPLRVMLVEVLSDLSLNEIEALTNNHLFTPWCPDPVVMDALSDIFRTDRDTRVRLESLDDFILLHGCAVHYAASCAGREMSPENKGSLPETMPVLNPQHRQALLAAAQSDPSVAVRMKAVECIAGYLGPEAVGLLVEAAAGDPEQRVREHASWLLSSPGATKADQGSLFSRDPSDPRPQRPAVIEALIEALQRETDHPRARSREVRLALHSALADLTDQDFGQDAGKWRAWLDAHRDDFK